MDKKVIGIILIVVAGIIFIGALGTAGAFYVLGIGGGSVDTGEPTYWQECQVTVKEKIIGKDVYFEDVSCTKLSQCGSIFGLLSFFEAEGQVQMWDLSQNQKVAVKDYKTGTFSGEETLTIRGCSTDNFELRLYDDNKNLMEAYNP